MFLTYTVLLLRPDLHSEAISVNREGTELFDNVTKTAYHINSARQRNARTEELSD